MEKSFFTRPVWRCKGAIGTLTKVRLEKIAPQIVSSSKIAKIEKYIKNGSKKNVDWFSWPGKEETAAGELGWHWRPVSQAGNGGRKAGTSGQKAGTGGWQPV